MKRKQCLPFLHVPNIRNCNSKFDVFRRDTYTHKYIIKNSQAIRQHKMATLNFLDHRLSSFPLKSERFDLGIELIKQTNS